MQQRYSQTEDTGKLPAENEQPLAGVQVLLVEDELDVADLLLFILDDAGAESVWVMHSNEALACLSHFHPDILLSNVRLPDHDGDWLIQKIRQSEINREAHLPAIALTSYTREVVVDKVLTAGFDRFIHKHFDPTEIISTILDLL
ncbi:MAG TPA: response regulator [Stenomitos sp.]